MNENLLKFGTILADRYQICQKLSHKPGRQTFLAEDIHSQDLVVIKILQFDNFFQWQDLKLFEREGNILKNLDRPAIPKYLDYFEIDEENVKGFALVQTYIQAMSVETTIENGRRFSEAEVIEFAEKMLDILIYLHEQIPPVIHRDIKPSNILIDNRSGNSIGDVYLVDFGSVQTVASKDNGTITIVGSYGYIPLEQFGGQTTTASDLYSLGMTLIYLITGVHPAELPQENGRVKFNDSALSSKFSRWLEKMTHPYLEKRFDSAKLAKTALRSRDGSSGDYLHLRPANSQVKLYRDRHKLEIVYQDIIYENISTLFFFVFLVIWIAILYCFGWNLFWPGLFFSAIVSSCINAAYPKRTRYRSVSIDLNGSIKMGILQHKESTQVKWDRQSSLVKAINLLAYNPGYAFDRYLDETGKVIKRGEVKIHPKLSIYAGHLEYQIGNFNLSQAELWWLGQELSDFLGLELQIIYPTPQAPPEPICGGC
jgi:serine/threonine protein kinase